MGAGIRQNFGVKCTVELHPGKANMAGEVNVLQQKYVLLPTHA